ncbi:MAG: hypothetical protein ABSF28_05665 [Terracidiphilus sp.]|jgi:hypothetical protein
MTSINPDQEPKLLLEVLAEIKRVLQDRAIQLKRLPNVTGTHTSLEAISYRTGPVLEGYLDVIFGRDDGICWSFDVRWDRESWTIEATLDRKSLTGQKTVRELPVKTVAGFNDFVEALREVVRELLALDISEAGVGPWSAGVSV